MSGRSRLCGAVTKITFALICLEVASGQSIYTEYGARLQEIAETAERTIAIESLWQQIANSYPQIMEQTRLLYWSIQTDIIDNDFAANDTMVLSAAYALRQELRRYLILRNAQVLANTLAVKGTILNETRAFDKYRNHLMRSYELEVVQDIFTKVIDELYNLKGVEHLSNALELIRSGIRHYGALQLYAHSRLYLFWKFINQGDVNDQYMLNEAHYMQYLRDKNILGGATQRRVEIAIGFLPTPLLRVASGDSFCLRNVEYNNLMYMTGKVNVDNDRGWIFLWRRNEYWGTEAWELRNKTEYDGKKIRVKYALYSPTFKQYLYMATDVTQEENVILAWRNGKVHPNSYWDVEVRDNKIVFSQNDYIMCTSDKQRDSERNKIYGYKDKHFTDTNPACQWIAEDCKF